MSLTLGSCSGLEAGLVQGSPAWGVQPNTYHDSVGWCGLTTKRVCQQEAVVLESIEVGQTLAPYLPALWGCDKAFPFLSLSFFISKTRTAVSALRVLGREEMVKGFRSDSRWQLPRTWGDIRSCELGPWDWAGGDGVSAEPHIRKSWGSSLVVAGVGWTQKPSLACCVTLGGLPTLLCLSSSCEKKGTLQAAILERSCKSK